MTDNRKQNIRSKILYLIIPALLLLAITMGSVSVYAVAQLAQDDSEKIMGAICDNEVMQINNQLNQVRQAVEMIYDYSEEVLKYNEDSFDIYSEEYESRIRELAIAVANKTEGAMAVYLRYDPEKTGSGTSGFFWSRDNQETEFSEQPPTDILEYIESDTAHVGWFYIPKSSGKALWMKPYQNENLDVFMISYVVPIFLENGEFVGVLGMDIDFDTILSATGNIHLYDSGSIALVDIGERLIYRNEGNGRTVIHRLSNSLYNHITTINKKSDVLTIYDERGKSSSICCKKLNNGMFMCVFVPLLAINSRRDNLLVACIILSVVIFTITTFAILRRIKKIINPINQLTEITKKYAKGDWSESYTCDTRDEIEDLSNSISIMAQNTQKYIKKINDLARVDSMTGINNKTYYLERIEEIKAMEEPVEYALTVMDLNLLKRANDVYGHEAGDLLIKEAALYISRIFTKSELFRIGGDEFVAISFGDDYVNREKLLNDFESGMYFEVQGLDNLKLAISFGMACKPCDAADYDELFNIADQRMYEKKRQMKLSRQEQIG